MYFREKIVDTIESTKIGKRALRDSRYRMVLSAACGFCVNLLYALYHGGLGIINRSLWFITMCAYYTILSTTRFSVVLCEWINNGAASDDMEYFVMKLCGGLLAALSFVLTGIIHISLAENIATKYETITMITIACYVFYRIAMTIIRAIKQRKNPSPLLAVIRNIAYADVAASVLTLQRSMLVSFGESSETEANTMNLLTGAAVCMFIWALGATLIMKGKGKKTEYGKIKICKGK